jgi:hypothetical protein
LLKTGELLMYDAWETSGTASVRLWNPDTGAFTSVPNTTSQLFCSAHVGLPDGRLLVIGGYGGGEVGIKDANIFDPVTRQWSLVKPMNGPRWYPGAVELGDGRIVAVSGNIAPGSWANTPEVYSGTSTNTWTNLTAANTSFAQDDGYPMTYLMPDGRVFIFDPEHGNLGVLDATSGTITRLPSSPVKFGASVMYRPGQVLVAGGGADWNQPSGGASAVIDLTVPSPVWRTVAPMAFPRYQHSLVSLPDGQVIAIGGSRTIDQATQVVGPLTPEIWNPVTETWTQVAAMQQPRMYHSTAILLPDGRVLAAGGGRWSTATDYASAEIYSPPYLFAGARPTITTAPSTMTYGATATIQTPDAQSIAAVALIGLGTVTHTLDPGQRYVTLPFVASTGSITVTLPENRNVLAPGHYMLFLSNSAGVPSSSKIVQMVQTLDTEAPSVSVSAPSVGATVSGAVPLAATASDNVGVNSAQFYVDGLPVGPTVTAPPWSTTWDSTTVANGTHTIGAQAVDAAGNTTTSAGADVTVSNAPGTPTPPAFRAAATVMSGTTVAKPAGTAAGDLLLAALYLGGDPTTVGGPAGWTRILDTRTGAGTSSVFHAQVWWKLAGASEPTSFSWSVPGGTYTDIALLAYTGINQISPIDIAVGRDAGVTATPVTDSPSTNAANDMVVAAFMDYAYGSYSPGSGMSQRVNFDSVTLQDAVQSAAAPTGTKTATNTSSGRTSAQLIALRGKATDTQLPAVSVTRPAVDATLSGPVDLTATASDNVGVATVQFFVDGASVGPKITAPPYTLTGWDSTTVINGPHSISAKAADAAGNTATSAGVSVTTSNTTPPQITNVASATTATTAAISWTTDRPADSQVEYGPTAAYGSMTAPDTTRVSAHSQSISGLVANSPYHYRVRSRDLQGNIAISADATFTTQPTPPPPTSTLPLFRSVATVMNGTRVNRPAGTVTGDLLLAVIYVGADPSGTAGPAGWTLLNDTRTGAGTPQVFHAQVWYKLAGAAEPTSYLWSAPGGVYVDIALMAYRNVDQSNPIDVVSGRDAGVTAQPITDAVTTTAANDLVVAAFINYNYGSFSAGSGMTRRVNFDSLTVQDAPQAAAGSTGTKTATNTVSGRSTAQIVTLRGQ